MTCNRRNRERKEVSRNSANNGFKLISIIILLQSISFGLAENENICAGKPFGTIIEDLTDCTSFFECIFEEPEQSNCPTGQRFDANTEKCVVGKCPPCKCDTVTTTSSPTTSSEEPASSSSESSASTDLPTSSEFSTSESTISTGSSSISTDEPSSTPVSSPSPGNECSNEPYCQASEDGTFHRDRNDCRKYYVCKNGEAVAHTCMNGMYFDDVSNLCNLSPLVHCTPSTNDHCTPKPTESSSSSSSESSSSESSTSPSTESSSTPPSSSESTTATELPTSSESSTSSSESTTSEPTTSTESSSTSTEVSSSSITSPNPETDCSNESYCQASEDGTFHRDRKDCRKYYVCRNGKAVAHTCMNGMYFDDVTNLCNFSPLVHCTPSTNDNCTPKPTESSSSSSSESSPSESSTSPAIESSPTPPTSSESTTATELPTTSEPSTSSSESTTSEPTTLTGSSSTSTEVSSSSVTSPKPETDCSNEPYCQASEHGTFHRDRKDCRKYYVCRNGGAVAHYCDNGMYFDDVAIVCNFASLVTCSPNANDNCTPKPTESASSSSSESASSESSTSPSTESPSTSPTSSESTTPTELPTTSASSTSSPGTECSTEPNCQTLKEGSLHRDKKDCRKFYVCLSGNPFALLCPSGEYYNDVVGAQGCQSEELVECSPRVDENCNPITTVTTPSSTSSTTSSTSTTSTTSTTTSAPPTNKPDCSSEPDCKVAPRGSMHRDPKDCAKFYFCRNGVAVARSCRKGEYFDLKTNACLFSSLVDCQPIQNCPPTDTTSSVRPAVTQTTTLRPSASTTMVPNGQVDPNVTDCQNLPNGAFFRHSTHCNVYYVCRNRMAVKHSCPYRLWFDDKSMVCNFRELVNCPSEMD